MTQRQNQKMKWITCKGCQLRNYLHRPHICKCGHDHIQWVGDPMGQVMEKKEQLTECAMCSCEKFEDKQ